MANVKMPSESSVLSMLRSICNDIERSKRQDEEDETLDVRLQVLNDGSWRINYGDASYDTDHHGYWGATRIGPDDSAAELRAAAADLISQADDAAAQDDEGDGEDGDLDGFSDCSGVNVCHK